MDDTQNDNRQEERAPAPPATPAQLARHTQFMAMEATGDTPMAIIPRKLGDVVELSKAIHASGLAPSTLNSPDKVAVAIMMGLELGLPPMQALQGIAVINGRPSVWGNLGLALIQRSGLLEEFTEGFEGEEAVETADFPNGFKAWVQMKRKGQPAVRAEYSVADAKRARLWNGMDLEAAKAAKTPWARFPKPMLRWRARWDVMNALFTDVLKGMSGAEEMQGTEMVDVTPNPPPAARTRPVADIGASLQNGAKPEVVYMPTNKIPKSNEAQETRTDAPQTADQSDVATGATQEEDASQDLADAAGNGTADPVPGDMFGKSLLEEIGLELSAVTTLNQLGVLRDDYQGSIDSSGVQVQAEQMFRDRAIVLEAQTR